MLTLVDIKDSGIDIRNCVGRRLDVLVEDDGRLEGFVFQQEGE